MKQPLVSAVVITYRIEKYIIDTLDSVFGQDYQNLEIVITDDNSPDNTFQIIKEYVAGYKGPHKVVINQNNPNLGIAGNVNKGIELSSGEYICLFDGDDVAYPNRVSKSLDIIQTYNVEGMTSNMEIIDSDSISRGLFFKEDNHVNDIYRARDMAEGKVLSGGAARMFSRRLAEVFGPLNTDCNTEDSTYLFRTILMGGIAYYPYPLVKYRIHGHNISLGENLFSRFDPQLIYNQYYKDLGVAKSIGSIKNIEFDILKGYIDRYLHNNLPKREISIRKNKLIKISQALRYFFNQQYSIKEVFRLIIFAINQ